MRRTKDTEPDRRPRALVVHRSLRLSGLVSLSPFTRLVPPSVGTGSAEETRGVTESDDKRKPVGRRDVNGERQDPTTVPEARMSQPAGLFVRRLTTLEAVYLDRKFT